MEVVQDGGDDEALIAQAVRTARDADVAVVMLGLPDSFESEGFDRAHMRLPENQNRLMAELVKTGVPIVVVLSTGSAVLLPWREQVDSILLMYLGGQNGGSAAADLLLGRANPSGKLAETWPLAQEDTPCHGFFGNGGNVEYRESIYVGYRYYDKARKEVAYPFGHGLGYTDFEYTGLTLSAPELEEGGGLTVRVTVKNTGALAGKEAVQLYVAPPTSGMFRPVRELRAYAKVELAPGESKTVELALNRRAFAYYDAQAGVWRVDSGTYTVEAGSSSRDIRLRQTVVVRGEAPSTALNDQVPAYCDPAGQWPVPKEQFEAVLGHPVPPERSVRPFTVNSTLGEIQATPAGMAFVQQARAGMAQMMDSGESDLTKMIDAMLADMPLRQLAMLSGGTMTSAAIDNLLEMLNGHASVGSGSKN